jgi:N utilization substance protein A
MSKTNFEFLDALGQIARDKGISVETLLDALANALVAAYKRRPDAAEEAVVTIDPDSGEIRVYGQELNEEGEVVREWDDTPDDFGRIAAQTAKQVILQRIREVERDMKYEEYAGREGDIVTGIVQQTDNRYTLLDLGKVEALLPQAEQVSYERYEHGARLKAYIVEVRKTTKGPQIVVSRTHPGLIKRLFELEVPEIGSGVVEIKAAAREPGHRTKIAVWSNDPNVDPVGACVGARGSRVRMVTNELRGERVDVVPFSDDPVELIQNALAPARVREVRLDEETGTATVIVSDFQLSLAIGKEGQNARLAARLTGWRIDIKSETQLAEEEAGGYGDQDWAEGEWIEDEKGELVWKPAEGGEAMSAEEWTHQAEDPTEAPAAGSGETDGAAPAEPAATATATATAEGASEAGSEVEASVGEPEAAAEAVVEEIVVVTEVTRTCVGCRNALPADQLIRIVRLPGGALSVDRHGAGRGAWLCRESPGCLDEAVRRHGFQRAFGASIDPENLQQLRVHLGGAWERPALDVRG